MTSAVQFNNNNRRFTDMDSTINLREILRLHSLHRAGDPAGKRAVLIDADLAGAVLTGADLRGAVLRGAVLIDADLAGAVLIDADLAGAVLRWTVLRKADLRKAVLAGANLAGADLAGANLAGADLREADLREANLAGADLAGVIGLPIVEDAPQRLRAVAIAILANPGALDMTRWHSECGTAHCLAGWAIHQAGPLGRVLEELQGPAMAGRILLGHEAADRFCQSNAEVLDWLQTIAAE